VSFIQQSLAAAQAAYEQVNQAGRKFSEMAESGIAGAAARGNGKKRA